MFQDRCSPNNNNEAQLAIPWKSVAEIVRCGFQTSPVVMANEFHRGNQRCIRTRVVGCEIIWAAHQAGCRTLAAEAVAKEDLVELNEYGVLPSSPKGHYLAQPDMQRLLQMALELGWNFAHYEADSKQFNGVRPLSMVEINMRECEQAQNLHKLLDHYDQLLVWCGNGHHCKVAVNDWNPMGFEFQKASGIEPFCIDQTQTVNHGGSMPPFGPALAKRHKVDLCLRGGTAGFLTSQIAADPVLSRCGHGYDALILSDDNEII